MKNLSVRDLTKAELIKVLEAALFTPLSQKTIAAFVAARKARQGFVIIKEANGKIARADKIKNREKKAGELFKANRLLIKGSGLIEEANCLTKTYLPDNFG